MLKSPAIRISAGEVTRLVKREENSSRNVARDEDGGRYTKRSLHEKELTESKTDNDSKEVNEGVGKLDTLR